MMRLWNLFGFFSKRSAATSSVGIDDITSSMRSEIGLSIRAESYNEAARTFDAVAATDSPVPMFDMEHWEVVDEILTAEGGEFPNEIPMLDSHDRSSVFKVLGNGTNPRRTTDGKWNLTLTFDDDVDSDRAMKKVAKRFIRDVSIGYTVEQCVYIQSGSTEEINGKTYTAGARRLKVCTKWRANEISLTPIGADKDAKIRAAVAIHGRKEETRHDELAAELHDLIIDTGLPQDEIVNDMASASGLSTSEVNEILEGNAAPNPEQLDGFAAVLETDTEPLAQLI